MNKILGIGNALVDVLARVESEDILNRLALPKGSMQLIETERYLQIQQYLASLHTQRTTGGSACNTVLAIAHLGGKTGLIGKIGHDEAGNFFADSFKAQGVATRLLKNDCLPTGVASTFITPDGQRTFGTYLGAAATLTADDVRREWFEGYDYFYIEGYLVQNHDLIRRAVDTAHNAGLKVCIDLASYNIVQAERNFFSELLRKTDIVFANEQEATAFTGVDNAQHNLETLAGICPMAVVKIGKQGVWVRHGDRQVHCPAREVPKVIDTTAAGDYFAAGFMHALSNGGSMAECARLGSLLAGHIIEVVGTALPEDIWRRIRTEM